LKWNKTGQVQKTEEEKNAFKYESIHTKFFFL